MGIWLKSRGSRARWQNTQIKVNPTQVHEQIRHPVFQPHSHYYVLEGVLLACLDAVQYQLLPSLGVRGAAVVHWNLLRPPNTFIHNITCPLNRKTSILRQIIYRATMVVRD